MPATIVNQFTEASGALYLSSIIALALILMVIAVMLNGAARLLIWGMRRGYQV